MNARRAFMLVEVLIVVFIVALVGSVIGISLSRSTRTQALASTAAAIISSLEDARSRTLASRAGSQYGVHLEDGSVTLFRGSAYDPGSADNEVTSLDARTTVTPALNGGGADVVFERLSGETDDFGTITIGLSSGPAPTKVITLQQTGLLSYDD